MKYYYDVRTGEVQNENELDITCMPPEFYFEVCENTQNFFIEKWLVGNNSYIDVAYTPEQKIMADNIRSSLFEQNNVNPLCITRYTMPKKDFKKLLNEFGYDI